MDEGKDPIGHGPHVQSFFRFLEGNWKNGFVSIDGAPEKYLPYSKLKAYLSEKPNLRNLLSEIFHNHQEQRYAREAIQCGYYKCFAILLYLKEPQYFKHFTEHEEYHDDKLPCYHPAPWFPADPSGNISFDRFSDCQWKFCVPALDYREYTVRQEKILPFKILGSIPGGEGGSGRLYKIQVDPEYDKLHPNAKVDSNTDSRIYVLKHFKNMTTAEDECRREIEGFKSVCQDPKDEEGIVGFYGGFCHNGAHSILLEYANEGSLEDYFQSDKIPQETSSFWLSFVPVSKAIAKIHNSRIEGTVYEGWHQDIKPKNILAFSHDGKLTFKLSDLGLVQCVRKEPDGVCRRRCSYGTRTYGAPECREPTLDGALEPLRRVTGSIDVWSFACVLSEAAVYFKYSANELEKYRNKRRENDGVFTQDCDCFHSGYYVSDIVKDTHRSLRELLRAKADDVLTPKVLDLIESALVPETDRPFPHQFSLDLQKTFSQFKGSKHPSTPEEYDKHPRHSTHPFHQESREPRCHPSPSPSSFPRVQPVNLRNPPMIDNMRQNDVTKSRDSMASWTPSTCPGSRPPSERRPESGRRPPSERQPTLWTTQSRSHRDSPSFTADGANIVASPPGMYMSPSPNSVSPPDTWNNGLAKDPLYASGVAEHMPGDSGAKSSMDQGITGHNYELSPPNDPELVHPLHGAHVPCSGIGTSHNARPTSPCRVRELGHLLMADANAEFDRIKASRPRFPGLSKPDMIGVSDKNEWRMRELSKRDHVFLVDDASSMKPHWKPMLENIRTLAYMVKRSDDDGLDLHFMINDKPVKHIATSSKLFDHVQKRFPSHSNQLSNIDNALGKIITKYQNKLKTTRKTRRMSVYVFTDGMWQDRVTIPTYIENLARDLDKHNMPPNQFGIQFIQFGSDPTGTMRLQSYDDCLDNGQRDIVDTEPSDGNVWKMLLGSINKSFDKCGETQRSPATPVSLSSFTDRNSYKSPSPLRV
ncbi:hypothetical protein FQN52_008126 [Onygenales sp. PD_12]|nr:hypothetical protein FQN52_008126 [Onygenales sp. PD_12]